MKFKKTWLKYDNIDRRCVLDADVCEGFEGLTGEISAC
jgi:hypothetical protein